MKTLRFLTLIVTVLMFSIELNAQNNSTLTGTVKDPIAGETMVGANVYFKGTSIGTITDVNGKFIIKGIPIGEYTLVISYIGYENYQEQVEIKAGTSVHKNVKLVYSGGVNMSDVVITAQARGQLKAINEQLAADNIKNVVSSDRIRELPDANAAESLARLPGVSLQRKGGEGDKVIIRGLSPKYTKVMIDGVDLGSTGGNDRSVSLNGISAYSLEGIEVVKSGTADMDADMMGGAVNFKLRSARDGLNIEAMGKGSYNHIKRDYGNYQIVGSVSDRFFNNKVGLFLMMETESVNRSAQVRNINVTPINSGIDTSDIRHYQQVLSDENRRVNKNGITLVADYRLKNGSLKFKNFYANRSTQTVTYNQIFPTTSRTITLNTTDRIEESIILNNNLVYEQEFGKFKVTGQAAHSFNSSESPQNMQFTFTNDGGMDQVPTNINPDSILNYSNFDVSRTLLQGFTLEPSSNNQRLVQADLNLEWAFTISPSISGKLKTGGKYKHQEKEYEVDYWNTGFTHSGQPITRQYIIDYPELFAPGETENDAYINYKYFMDPDYDASLFLDGEFADWPQGADLGKLEHLRNYVAENYLYDPDAPQSASYAKNEYTSNTHDYNGYENYYAGYLMGNFRIGSMIDFIPGVRYELNKTSYTGVVGRSDLSGPLYYRYVGMRDTTSYRENGYILPMIHIKVKPTKWLQIHLAYTHTLSRPNFNLIIPREDWSDAKPTKPSYIINNTKLEPELSKNIDLVVSMNNNYLGLFSINIFNKQIGNKIFKDFTRTVEERTEEFGIPSTLSSYNIDWYYNDKNGVTLRGVEIDWQTSFWYLPGLLKGLVFNANYTYTYSKAHYPHYETVLIKNPNPFLPDSLAYHKSTYEDRLLNQPAHTLNLALGYDYKGFSIRTSMRYQDNVKLGVSRVINMRGVSGSYLRFDVSMTQKIPYGITLFANFNNLNNAKDLRYTIGTLDKYPTRTEVYGMTIDLGLRWNLSVDK